MSSVFYFFFILSNGSVHAYREVLQLSGVVGLGLIPFSLDRASEGTFAAATDWCSSDSPLLDSSATDFGQVPEENMRRHYLSWLILGPFEFTPAGKRKDLSRNLVLPWIKQAWSDIPQEMVRWSFKTCGISNALEGMEDNAIYDRPEIDGEDEEMKEEIDTDSKVDDERWWQQRLLWKHIKFNKRLL